MPVDGLIATEQPAGFNARMEGIWETAIGGGNPYAGAVQASRWSSSSRPPKPASSRFICAVPGHAQAGMVGTFTITAAGDAVATPAAEEPFDNDEMDRMHEAGVKAFPAATAGLGGQPLESRHGRRRQGLRPDLPAWSQWEVDAGQVRRGLGLQRRRARSGDPRHRGRHGPRHRHQQAAGEHRRPLARPDRAEQHGRRAVHHPAADQAGRDLHLRVRPRGQRRLAHVPLAPQRGRAGRRWGCSARSSSSRRIPTTAASLRPRIHDDPQRRPARRLHAQRQGLPGHPAADRRSRARSCSSAT